MKKILFTILALAMLVAPALAADKTVVVTWTPNTETDMSGYTGYQFSSASDTTVDSTWTVTHPTATKSIVVNVPDNGTATVCVELDAFDTALNHSAHSSRVCATMTGSDTIAPAIPTNVKVTVQ
jgi:hypothetical protein